MRGHSNKKLGAAVFSNSAPPPNLAAQPLRRVPILRTAGRMRKGASEVAGFLGVRESRQAGRAADRCNFDAQRRLAFGPRLAQHGERRERFAIHFGDEK